MDRAACRAIPAGMKKGDHLFLVDGSGYIFRAYHALPPLNRKSDGLPVGAVSGFCNMLWKLMQDARNTDVGVAPTHFAVIFDYSSKTFRNELYAEYKANRSAPPEDLIPQFGLIRQATARLQPALHRDGRLRGRRPDRHLCAAGLRGRRRHHHHLLRQGSDAARRPHGRMYDPMKDRQIGIPEVIEKWGVPPEKMIDLQAMTGDFVDNVPGVPGIGPKTAAQLLEQFGDLDTLLARAGEIKQDKRRETIIANADKARISRELVTLKNDVPLDRRARRSRAAAPDGPKLIAFLKTMEFTTLTRRVAEATGTDAARWRGRRRDRRAAPRPRTARMSAPRRTGVPASAGRRQRQLPRPGRCTARHRATTPAAACQRCARSCRQRCQDRPHGAMSRSATWPTLETWIAEARETGIVAFDTETTSLDADAGRARRLSPLADSGPRHDGRLCAARPTRTAPAICSAAAAPDNQIPLREALAR